jgi:hypothetical protein
MRAERTPTSLRRNPSEFFSGRLWLYVDIMAYPSMMLNAVIQEIETALFARAASPNNST